MTSRLLVLAVLAVAAAATADGLRQEQREGGALPSSHAEQLDEPTAQFAVRDNRVLRNGREYLSAAQIKTAFPAPLQGSSFALAHVTVSLDGTVALATYNFPFAGPPSNTIELWRHGKLVSSFAVPPGSFGGGLGFSRGGALVATVAPDDRRATLYDRRGRRVASVSLTRG